LELHGSYTRATLELHRSYISRTYIGVEDNLKTINMYTERPKHVIKIPTMPKLRKPTPKLSKPKTKKPKS
jgi:hypothetical protein